MLVYNDVVIGKIVKDDKLAKNLLLGKECRNCLYKRDDICSDDLWCLKISQAMEELQLSHMLTCSHWEDASLSLKDFFQALYLKRCKEIDDLTFLDEFIAAQKEKNK